MISPEARTLEHSLRSASTAAARQELIQQTLDAQTQAERQRIIGILDGLGNHDSFDSIKKKIMGVG